METSDNSPCHERVQRALAAAQEQGLAALALVPGPNMRYLTGAPMHMSERLILGLLAPDRQPALVLPSFEMERVREDLELDARLFGYSDEEGPQSALAQACNALELRGKRVAAESLHMRLMEFWQLEEAGGAEVVAGDGIFSDLRMRKDARELAAMKEAIRRTERVLHDFLPEIRPGRTEKELAGLLRFALIQASGEDVSFPPILGSGPNGALPHAAPSDRPLQKGDLIVIDCGIFYHGYVSDITRTFALGQVEPELRRIYDVVLEANRAGREACGPGVSAESVDRAARAVVQQAGYGDLFRHRTGHGIGLEVHEPPYIAEGNAAPLKPGMTFTVEPGIYLPGRGGVRIEDDVAITTEGAEALTSFPRELLVL